MISLSCFKDNLGTAIFIFATVFILMVITLYTQNCQVVILTALHYETISDDCAGNLNQTVEIELNALNQYACLSYHKGTDIILSQMRNDKDIPEDLSCDVKNYYHKFSHNC